MYDPAGVGAMVTALRQPAQQGVQLAGDVIPLQIPYGTGVGPGIGHTNQAADYAWGSKVDPNISSIGKNILMEWLQRNADRIKSGR